MPWRAKGERNSADQGAEGLRRLPASRQSLPLVSIDPRELRRSSTVAIDEGRVSRHIVPLIGKHIAKDLTRQQLQKFYDDIVAGKTAGTFKTKARGKAVVQGGAGTAARVVELLGGIWAWGEERGLVLGIFPGRGIRRFRGDAKDRVLSADELAKLGQAMRDNLIRDPAAVPALRLIALTGLRREEACGLRWSEIDKASSCLRLESTKTGRSMRTVGKAAFDILDAIAKKLADDKKAKGTFVFPNAGGKASADLKKALATIFDAAGLKDARAHDMRRTFASIAAEEGFGDASIGELLGHAKRGVTERHYIRRADAALIAAADRVSQRIATALEGASALVIPLKERIADASRRLNRRRLHLFRRRRVGRLGVDCRISLRSSLEAAGMTLPNSGTSYGACCRRIRLRRHE